MCLEREKRVTSSKQQECEIEEKKGGIYKVLSRFIQINLF